MLRSVGATVATGALGSAAAVRAGAQEALPAPEDLTVVNVLDDVVQLEWSPVEAADEYRFYVDGENRTFSDDEYLRFSRLQPYTTYEVGVATFRESDRALSPIASTTVETAPAYDDYPVSLQLSVDPERTDAAGRPAIVVSVADLPEDDAAVEGYQLRLVPDDSLEGAFTDEARPWYDEPGAGPIGVTKAVTLDTSHEFSLEGTATGEAPTADDEPIELAAVFHEAVTDAEGLADLDDAAEELGIQAELRTLVGVEGSVEEQLAPWTVTERGVEDWSFETTSGASPPEDASTTVTFEDDRVVVSGTYQFPLTGCDSVAPTRLVYSAEEDILGVRLASFENHELLPDRNADEVACPPAVSYVDFELEVVPEGGVEVAGVRADGAMDERTLAAPGGWPRVDLPPEIADYEFTVGDAVDVAEAAETAPSVTVLDDQVVVEGALRFGSSTCYVPDLVDAASVDSEPGHARLVVGPRRREDAVTAGACSDDVTAREYELVLTPADDVPLDRLTVRGTHGDVETETTVDLGGSEPPAPCERSATVDGRTVCDLDGDGLHRDVTGDGELTQTDVVEFFQVQHREAWKRPELFDFSGNDAVGHGDVVDLFEYVAAQSI